MKLLISILLTVWLTSSLVARNFAKPSETDSLLQIVEGSAHDTMKLAAYVSLIVKAPSVEDALAYFAKGEKLAKRQTTPHHELTMLTVATTKICDLGQSQLCEKYYDKLDQLAIAKVSHMHRGRARLIRVKEQLDKGNQEKAEEYLDEIADILANHSLPSVENSYWVRKSLIAKTGGDVELALQYNTKALAALQGERESSELVKTYLSRGRIFRSMGNIDSAEQCYLTAEKFLPSRNQRELAVVYNNLGNINHIKGRYDTAIEYYMKSIAVKEIYNDYRGLAIGYHNVGAIKVDMQSYLEAIEIFEKSDEILIDIDFKILHVHNQLKIGYAYQGLEDYEKALTHHGKALEIAQAISFKKGEANAMVGVGLDQMRLGNTELAQISIIEAVQLAKEIKDKSEECSALIALAEWYVAAEEAGFKSSESLSYNEIEKLLLRAKALSQEMDYGEKKMLVYKGLDKLYTLTGDARKHNLVLQEYIALNDTLYQKSRTDAVAGWETKYKTAEQEKEIIKLEAENEIAKFRTKAWQRILAAMAVLFSIMGFLGYKYLSNRNARKRLEEAETFRTKLSSDLHDDVGTMLSSLAMQSEVMGLTAPPEQMEKFANLSKLSRKAMGRMRDTVWAIDSRKDEIHNLVERMNDYLSEMMNGHKLRPNFRNSLTNNSLKLRPDVRQNIFLIFKEAVNNACKYSNGDTLNMDLRQTKDLLTLSIHDNGVVDPSKIKTSGTGLSNLEMRAERIGGKLAITMDKGFEVVVSVPL